MPVIIDGTSGITFPDGNRQSQASLLTAIGSVTITTSSTPPANNYLKADGSVTISGADYPLLSNVISEGSTLRVSPNTAIIDRFGGTTTPAGTSFTADSAIDAGRGASAAFDGANADATNCWHTTNKGPPYYIRVTFSSPQRINYWDWQKRPDNTNFPTNWTLKGSNDGGSTWTTIYTKTGDGGQNAGSWNINTFENTNTYTVYQMDISASSSNQYCIIGEIRCGRIVAAGTIALPNITSTLPSGMYAHIRAY